MYKILLAQGVRDGVFHTRVGVRNSSVHYAPVPDEDAEKNGGEETSSLIDLVSQSLLPEEESTAIMQEIWPQPPGIDGHIGGQITHGIDYYTLHMLDALGERERFRALCRPFNFFPDSGAAPLWIVCVFINVSAGRVNLSDDPRAILQNMRSELLEHIYCGIYDWRNMDRPWELRVGTFVVV